MDRRKKLMGGAKYLTIGLHIPIKLNRRSHQAYAHKNLQQMIN